MWGARWLVLPVALTALAVGCSSSGPRPRIEEPQSASPTQMRTRTAEESVSKAELAKLSAFLDKATPIFAGTVPDAFSLEDLRYTSRTDAAASFSDCRNVIRDPCSTVIATTHDNWAHAAGLVIPDTLADLVDFAALGRGMVGIKAEDQFSDPGRSYPPFILYPDGRVRPLHVSYRPQAFDSGSDLLISDYGLSYEAGMETGTWALHVDLADAFELAGWPAGAISEHVPGREGALVSVGGYRRNVGDGVWHFAASADDGRTWRRTNVRLPLGHKPLWRYADTYDYAIGPRHLQALAMLDSPEDLPQYLRELWRTNDEKAFHRVPLPWERMAFGGMAFAADGALLLAEVNGPVAICEISNCDRPGRIWRLPPGGTKMRPLANAPRLFGPFWRSTLETSGGGMIFGRTGERTIALSDDGYEWTMVTPGH
jgi:hypothetical protein